jgi:hypothetical protein
MAPLEAEGQRLSKRVGPKKAKIVVAGTASADDSGPMATEIVLFVRFGIAATVALLMRSLDHDGLATLGTPAISYVALLYMLLKRRSRRAFRHRRSGRGVSKVMRPAGDGPALKSAPIQQHRCVAHSIRNGGMPQEVLEPPCVHSPGRQCISGRIPQHMLVMDRERQASGLACRLNRASNAHPTERLA